MTKGRRKSELSTRRQLCSSGRPPVWQREHLCRIWQGVATGLSSEEAAVEAGTSGPIGFRWFRSSGGMSPTHLASSAPALVNRNLTFLEREEIALKCARGTGIRASLGKLGRSSARRQSLAPSPRPRELATAVGQRADRARPPQPRSAATSVPVPIAMPTSACASAGSSLIPSPTKASALTLARNSRNAQGED